MADGRGRLSGLIPLVVVAVVVVLFARSCLDRLNPGDDEREPEDPELGQGQVIENGDGEPDQVGVPEVDEDELAAMLEPREPECPAEEGEEGRHLQWTEPPPMCVDEDSSYTATLDTSEGEIEIELDVENAPITVNNFVFLARWGYYDGTEFYAVLPDDLLRAGLLPSEAEVTGPGYTIEGEVPQDDEEDPYSRGVVAMSHSSEPGSGGAAFFISLGTEAPIEPNFPRVGEITDSDSRSVVTAIEDTGRRRPGGDGTPSEPTVIHEVVITESS